MNSATSAGRTSGRRYRYRSGRQRGVTRGHGGDPWLHAINNRSALRHRTDHFFMAAGRQLCGQSERQSAGPVATNRPKSIVPYDKECINEMRVAQRARRGSHDERAEPPRAKRDNPPFVRCQAE